jgi:hypothetical protein
LIVTEDDPVFLMVRLWVALVVPTVTLPKFKAVADAVICANAAEAGNTQARAAIGRRK